jgi:hypothetical protein
VSRPEVANLSFYSMEVYLAWPRPEPSPGAEAHVASPHRELAGSEAVLAEDLAASHRAQPRPDRLGDYLLDEPDGAIPRQDVDDSVMPARRRDQDGAGVIRVSARDTSTVRPRPVSVAAPVRRPASPRPGRDEGRR